MAANSDKDEKVTEVHQSKWAWVIIIVPVLILGTMVMSWLGGSESSDSGGAASTSAPAEKEVSKGSAARVYDPGIPDEVRNAPASDGQLFFDGGAKEVHLDVPVGSWSAEVVTPQSSKDYRLNVKPDKTVFYVKFADGHIEKVGGGEKRCKDVKIRRGIMRIYGTVPGQKATVEVD